MISRRSVRRFLGIGCAAIATVVFTLSAGCSGGKGGKAPALAPSGTVSILIADGPALEFDHVWVDITRVSLLPAGGGAPAVAFEGKETIDLLRFQEEDFVLASGRSVPAGTYEKIRLEISGIRVEPAVCDEVKLPSGKIDLNPQGTFEVAKDGSIVVRIDIDAKKSITIHQAGKSGKCIFRPVVFVDVLEGSPALCRQEIAGTIVKILDPEDDPQESGHTSRDGVQGKHGNGNDQGDSHPSTPPALAILQVDLGSDRGIVRVAVEEGTAVFDAKALPAGLAALDPGDAVRVRGRMDGCGRLAATWVIEGRPEDLQGTFGGPIEGGRFTLEAGGAVDCRISEGTKAFGPCDEPIPLDSIRSGQPARILGASDSLEGETFLRVAVIDLGPTEVRGRITAIDGTTGDVTVHPQAGDDVTFHVTADTAIVLVGDGSLTAGDLRVDETIVARLDPVTGAAVRIAVEPEDVAGEVGSFDASARTFTLTPDPPAPAVAVTVFPAATVLLIQGSSETRLVDLSELRDGDAVTVFGLIPASGLFDARVVLIRR